MDASFFLLSGPALAAGLALLFAFSNGFRDSSTIVATVVSTRTLSPRKAFALCGLFEFLGALAVGSAVAVTISQGLLGRSQGGTRMEMLVVLGAAMGVALIWGIISWWQAWPTSNNQAVFSGLVGSSVGVWGPSYFQNFTVAKVLLVLILSPMIGFTLSILVTKFLRFVGGWLNPSAKKPFEKFHVLACLIVSLAHGSNDGQLVMGLLMVALGFTSVLVGTGSAVEIPVAIRILVALSISAGVLMGGKRILKQLGMRFYRIKLMQGLGSQISSAGTVLACALTGFPASTTQVITGSIVGAGVAKNPRAVRWEIAQHIVWSWVLTIPTVAFLSWMVSISLKFGLGI